MDNSKIEVTADQLDVMIEAHVKQVLMALKYMPSMKATVEGLAARGDKISIEVLKRLKS